MIGRTITSIADAQCGFAGYLFKIKKILLVRDSIWTNSQTNQLPPISQKGELEL